MLASNISAAISGARRRYRPPDRQLQVRRHAARREVL